MRNNGNVIYIKKEINKQKIIGIYKQKILNINYNNIKYYLCLHTKSRRVLESQLILRLIGAARTAEREETIEGNINKILDAIIQPCNALKKRVLEDVVDKKIAIALHSKDKRLKKANGNWINVNNIRKKKYISINAQIIRYTYDCSNIIYIKKINKYINHDRYEDNAVFGLIGGL